MLRKYHLTVWYVSRTNGEMQFLPPMLVEAVDDPEAFRTATTFADFMFANFAAKVMVRIEGNRWEQVIERQTHDTG
jgi:hypothetical protein